QKDQAGENQLTAYLVADEAWDKQGLESDLKAHLPAYMIPSFWIPLNQFPTTPSGKIDLKALPKPDYQLLPNKQYQAPRTKWELALAKIWQDLMKVERIGLADDFFDLGGHSLIAMRVLAMVRKQLKVDISLQAIFEFPKLADLSAHIEQLSGNGLDIPALAPRQRPPYIPLSFAQERIWYVDQLEGSLSYHIPSILQLKGELDVQALQAAFTAIMQRHEILRTVYLKRQGLAYQKIEALGEWQVQHLSGDQFKTEEEWQLWLDRELSRPFDLEADAMLRVHLIERGARDYTLVMILHHIAADGWSMSILINELTELYRAKVERRPAILAALQLQYADYAIWERMYLNDHLLAEKMAWWEKQLKGADTLQLPLDFPRPAIQSSRGARVQLQLSEGLSRALADLAKQQEATLFMTLLTAFKVLLYRYTGQYDICVGTPIVNRSQQELEQLIGFFLNNLALRSDLSGNPSFRDLLTRVKQTTLAAFSNRQVPFAQIVSKVAEQRDMSYSPLFQAVFVLNNTPDSQEVDLSALELRQDSSKLIHSTTDLHLLVTDDEQLSLSFTYCRDLFHRETIERMVHHFERILEAIIQNPQIRIGEIPMVDEAQLAQLMGAFNENRQSLPTGQTVIQLFEQRVKSHPDLVAVRFRDTAVSFLELDRQANQLAQYLIDLGVKKGDLVALCLGRSVDLVVATLAIMKAGAAYVPVDPELPIDRITYLMNDNAAPWVLSHRQFESIWLQIGVPHPIFIDQIDLKDQSIKPLAQSPNPEDLAYVIYTSGSTGQPKGVLIEHGSLANILLNQEEPMGLRPGKKVLQFASISFDAAAYEIFVSLIYGCTLLVPDERTILSAEAMGALLEETDFATLPTSYQQFVAPYLHHLETLVSVGEALDVVLAKKLMSQGVKMYNGYGPTENTIASSLSLSPVQQGQVRASIGRPFDNVNIYLLDEDGNQVPQGVIGEICMGGLQLARGYLNRVELTQERFVRHPRLGKLYHSGDLARLSVEGELEFIGRKDDQIKLRGYRIELGEIEQAISEVEKVNSCVVQLRKDNNDQPQLVAYVVGEKALVLDEIIAYLNDRLPKYMVPTNWVRMDTLPLLANGKVNKKALPDPDISEEIERAYVAPETLTEQKIAQIWAQLLELDQVGKTDHFFGLGGHSLLAVRLVALVQTTFEVELDIQVVFEFPVLGDFAQIIDQQRIGRSLPPVTAQERTGPIPLSFSQKRLWFIDQLSGSLHYHISMVLRLEGDLDRLALEKALYQIVERHEILRTVYQKVEQQVYQSVLPLEVWQLEQVDAPSTSNGREKEQWLSEFQEKAYDLAKEPAFRAGLYREDAHSHTLVLVLHHIAADGWSAAILINELTELYKANRENRPHQLAPLAIQYADYAIWQDEHFDGEFMQEKLNWWLDYLADIERSELSTDFPRPSVQSTRGGYLGMELEKATSDKMQALANEMGTSLFITLLTAFKVLLHRYTGQTDIVIGTPIANRPQQELEQLIGFFLNTLVLRSDLSGNPSFKELLNKVSSNTLDAFAHQEVPFEQIVERLSPERDLSRTPLFQVLFEMQNTPEANTVRLEGLDLIPEGQTDQYAKFDLRVIIVESPEGLQLGFIYCKDLFKVETIQGMMSHFQQLLQSIIQQPYESLSQLQMLSVDEQKQQLIAPNHTAINWPKHESLLDLFTTQVKQDPKAPAIRMGNKVLSYAELQTKAEQVAHYLVNLGVKPGSIIGLYAEPSIELMIALLGIMKTGAAYLPIPISHPIARVKRMLDNSQVKQILGSGFSTSSQADLSEYDLVDLEKIAFTESSHLIFNQDISRSKEDLAYILHTSGSTGQPKAVAITQGSLCNYLLWAQSHYLKGEAAHMALYTNIDFDLTVTSLYLPLISGGTVIIYPKTQEATQLHLLEVIAANEVNVLKLTPAHLRMLEKVDWGKTHISTLIVGGEALDETLVRAIQQKAGANLAIYNEYGPTETTVGSTCHLYNGERTSGPHVAIGKPIANTQVYVLNQDMVLLPIGLVGELYIGGAGLAQAYINDEEQTKERFLPNPFRPQERLYKTGDLVRWLPDRTLEFVGRADDQLKIRAHRIEPGEIEAHLKSHTDIEDAVVISWTDEQLGQQLVAYLISTTPLEPTLLRQFLAERLPEYMIPDRWLILDEFALTPSGKVDKKALPHPDTAALAQATFSAPQGLTEQQVAAIWASLLEVDAVGRRDHFFDLGGHSLMAIRVLSVLQKEMEVEVGIDSLFNHPILEDFAAFIDQQQKGTTYPAIGIQQRGSHIPLSYAQERLWFIDQLEGSQAYHIPSVLRLTGELDTAALEFAFRELIKRHEILRTVYADHKGVPYQKIREADAWVLTVREAASFADEAAEEAWINTYLNEPFDLSRDYMLRVGLIRYAADDHRLLVVLHHIASDGWSTQILVTELMALYQAKKTGQPVNLPSLAIQYADYAIWQREQLSATILAEKLAWWEQQLTG
ncbi:MAG: amino acid adenylation domain-containing protein, partial [Bacteroidota bacterium]